MNKKKTRKKNRFFFEGISCNKPGKMGKTMKQCLSFETYFFYRKNSSFCEKLKKNQFVLMEYFGIFFLMKILGKMKYFLKEQMDCYGITQIYSKMFYITLFLNKKLKNVI